MTRFIHCHTVVELGLPKAVFALAYEFDIDYEYSKFTYLQIRMTALHNDVFSAGREIRYDTIRYIYVRLKSDGRPTLI